MARDNGVWLLAIYLFLSIYLLPMFPHGGSANELTRWATAASIVEKGSFEISWTEPLIGPNVDTAKAGERIYSNKAPGTAILAAPVYALTRLFIGPPDASNIRISWFLMRFAIATLPMLFLGVWLYTRETDSLSLATLLFATPLFVYSLLFFSHVFAALVLYLAFRFIYDQRYVMPWHSLVSGALCGIAVVSEFTAIFPAAVFGFGLLFSDKRERLIRPLFFILGGLPFALLLGWYNHALFGSVFSMSYAHESFPEWAEVAGQGVFGIGWPSAYNFYLLLFSPSRGLFFAAPILLLSVLTFFSSQEAKSVRHRVKVAAIVLTVVVLSGHGAAHGGWAFGPRYLILIVPLLLDSIFDGETYEMSNLWQGLLFGLSLVLCILPALTFPFAPPEFSQPYRDLWVPYLVSEHWFVPNAGNVIGLPSTVWAMLPVFAAFILVVYLVLVNMRRPKRFLVGLSIASALLMLYLFIPSRSVDPEKQFRQATIAERFFRPAGRLDEFSDRAANAGDRRLIDRIRQAEWMIAEARAHAPNDFPYLPSTELSPAPSGLVRRASQLQQQGRVSEAEHVLRTGIERFDFAKCELTTNLAVIAYTSGDRERALSELESVQPLVNSLSSPDCLRSQYLIGTLYREMGDEIRALAAFNAFLTNSAGSNDPQIVEFRKNIQAPRP